MRLTSSYFICTFVTVNFKTVIKPIGIFLLSLFLYSQVYNTSVWINYELNIEEITDAFCVNTEKPELNCLGTCHLKKQLIQTDNNTPLESEVSFYFNEIQLFSDNDFIKIEKPIISSSSHLTIFEDYYSTFSGLDIFHPPKA